jgi:hypothetical protein
MANNMLIDNLSEPLNGTKIAKVDVYVGDGNLTIDRLSSGEQVLASGTLQYFENQGAPTRTLDSSHGQTTFTLRSGRATRPWFHFPWEACNGATDWRIHLNPTVSTDIEAHSGGGNVKLDLAGMDVTRLSADTGGGNLHAVLPENAANLKVTAGTGGGNVTVEIGSDTSGNNIISAKSGAGNVEIRIPAGMAARIHAATGLGKVILDPRFSQMDKNTYQSSDFDSAANKVEITAHSGAGNVIVNSR